MNKWKLFKSKQVEFGLKQNISVGICTYKMIVRSLSNISHYCIKYFLFNKDLQNCVNFRMSTTSENIFTLIISLVQQILINVSTL